MNTTKILTRVIQIIAFIGLVLVLLLFQSCNDSNPMQMEEPCCVTPPYHEVMSMEQQDNKQEMYQR